MTISPGPRLDWFEPSAWRRLLEEPWTVSADCDRVGVRLEGPRLDRVRTEELPSEGLLRGAIQVPTSGQPLIFLSDHPVTGGYPVVAVLTERACDHAAQLRPGDAVRFQAATRG
jgi:allophanate hydrolase subunit 2